MLAQRAGEAGPGEDRQQEGEVAGTGHKGQPERPRFLPLIQRPGSESGLVDRPYHLFNRHHRGIVGDPRLSLFEAYVSLPDAVEPYQGPLDREGSGPSGHPVHLEGHSRDGDHGPGVP